MKPLPAQMTRQGWIVAGLLLFALGVLPGVCAAAPAAYPKCPGSGPLAVNAPYCLHQVLPRQTLGSLATQYGTTPEAIMQANQEPRVSGHKRLTDANLLRAGERILIPTPSLAPHSPEPKETLVAASSSPIEQPIPPPVSDVPATLPAAPARSPDPEPLPPSSMVRMLALASGSAVAVLLIGFVLVRASFSRAPHLLHPSRTAGQETPQLLIVPERVPAATPQAGNTLIDVHTVIQYLSTPKEEDCMLAASNEWLSALAVADGASICRGPGGEISGGGGEAARIAAQAALTHLTDRTHPALTLEAMLTLLSECFAAANTALLTHNGNAPLPGATTLILAALWQAGDGRWYWLYGNVGDGVLSLIHTRERLAGWPVETPLLTKQANGLRTITLPGYTTHGFQPSVGLKPHRPGDILLLGSDGLAHLDAVTKQCDRLTLPNYLLRESRQDPSRLETTLAGLRESRQDASWQHAFAADDTTIGLIWAEETHV